MNFQFVQKRYDTHFMLERQSNTIITYYTKHKLDELYPKGGYEVIGEIGNNSKRFPNQDEIVTEAGIRIPVFPRGSRKRPFEWVIGYSAVSENTYVAVVKSIIPRLIK